MSEIEQIQIRPERPEEYDIVAGVIRAAFDRDDGNEPIEVPLLAALRGAGDYVPELALVAERAGYLAGFVISTNGRIAGQEAKVVGLGPIGVRPDTQLTGIGSALMTATIDAATGLGYDAVCLLGEPAYYARFGFVTATDLGVISPDPSWGPYFQALALTTTPLAGRFEYSAPFNDLE